MRADTRSGLAAGLIVIATGAHLGLLAGCQPPGGCVEGTSAAASRADAGPVAKGKRDDWAFAGSRFRTMPRRAKMAPAAAGARIGLSAGGAKDVANFRENIKKGYLPLPTDLTYEGLFYDYYFDTGEAQACKKLFCPSYVPAVSKDPFSGEKEYFLSVGLNSGIEERSFKRKKLNLVIVLDISGSMSMSFDRYYYDRFGNRQARSDASEGGSKLGVAARSIAALIDHLRKDDRLGMVVFDDTAYLAKPLGLLGDVDVGRLKQHILALGPGGGTNMESGLREGTALLDKVAGKDPNRYESRIIFLTDAMPNTGDTSDEGLLGKTRKNAGRGIYTTFIGMGVDFNTELIERITKIRGANYYSVHSAKEFKKRLDEEFEFMVTPLVFDLSLKLQAQGYKILKVYGSPEANEATGELMKVNTLFPSKTEAGQTRGGVILLKLRKLGGDGRLTLTTSYVDRAGRRDGDSMTVRFPDAKGESYPTTGVRKAVLLSHYADLLLNWILDVRRSKVAGQTLSVTVDRRRGCPVPMPRLGRWERQSVPLTVPGQYRPLLERFRAELRREAGVLKDKGLEKEVAVLDLLIKKAQ